MNAVIKTGLAKGVTTQNLMVSLRAARLVPTNAANSTALAGTMGLPSTRRRDVHQL